MSRELVSLGLAPAHDSLTLDDLKDPDKLSELHKRKRAALPPPEQGSLEELREKRQKEKEMQQLVRRMRAAALRNVSFNLDVFGKPSNVEIRINQTSNCM